MSNVVSRYRRPGAINRSIFVTGVVMFNVATAVHTTGINLEGLLTTLSSIVVIMAVFGGLMVRAINRSINDQTKKIVEDVIKERVEPVFQEFRTAIMNLENMTTAHAVAIARLQGVNEGVKRQIGSQSNANPSEQQ